MVLNHISGLWTLHYCRFTRIHNDLTLKTPNFPSLLRVPSGKKKTEAPFFIRSMHRLRQSYMQKPTKFKASKLINHVERAKEFSNNNFSIFQHITRVRRKRNTNWLLLSMRFKGITPKKNMAQPIMGKRKMLVLLMNLKGFPRVRRVYMSRKLWWLDT